MKNFFKTSSLILAMAFVITTYAASAQETALESFTSHNARMSELQPAWVTPLVEADPRLLQYIRASFSNESTSTRTQTTSYGNARGGGLIVGNRFEFDYVPPPYIQHNVASSVDGLGDTSLLAKVRIASGNAKHGNFAVAALVNHSFATGTYKNGATTDTWGPTLAGGYAFKRMNLQTCLGGTMPTGKIASQGRSIAWSSLTQLHTVRPLWFEVEDNSIFYFEGSHDGKMQNFVTPAAFYVVRPKSWKKTHPFFLVDSGMQIATSGFHTYNHNLISEVRMLF